MDRPVLALSGPWTDDPLFFDVDLPFREGVTMRPCAATYSVMGQDRLEHAFRYEGSRLRAIDSTVGEMAGEGHRFCLPSSRFVRIQELDPLTLTLAYDGEGRLVQETIAAADGGAPLSSTSFVRDASGRLVAVERTGELVEEERETIVWEDGRIVSRDTELGGVRVEHDEAGHVVRRSDSSGETSAVTRYVYDSDGRVSTVTRELFEDSDEPGATSTARFEYDGAGRLAACALDEDEARLRIVYAYDGEGRLVRRAAIDPASDEEEAWAWAYRYDCRRE